MNKRITKILIAVGVQLSILFGLIMFNLLISVNGQEIILAIEPVDPRSPLRGDYVTFDYEVSNISNIQYKYLGSKTLRVNQEVYITLFKSLNVWTVKAIKTEKPTGEDIFIKGRITSVGKDSISLEYGIEEYYIPEGTGIGFNFRNVDATARVKVDSNGNALLQQIYVNGEVWP